MHTCVSPCQLSVTAVQLTWPLRWPRALRAPALTATPPLSRSERPRPRGTRARPERPTRCHACPGRT
eukprot:1426877-Lingulodinium_polyedra.AAC.1